MNTKTIPILLCLCAGITAGPVSAQVSPVTLRQKDNTVTLGNGLASFSFNIQNADLTAIRLSQPENLLGKKGRGYLMGPAFSMSPSRFRIVRQTDSLVEISFYHEADNHFQYDLHYILRSGESGIYCFLYQTHRANDPDAVYGQTRWGIRADERLFDYHLVRDSIQGPMPKMADLQNKVQDWTYQLADGSYYTKYDYADYIEGRHVHGMAGIHSGLGLFVIQAGHDYLNGGPTKQYQDVHATPFLICMFNGSHFLSDIRKADDHITGNWSKLSGPFFLYVNRGKDIGDIWQDAKRQARQEGTQWPYAWMHHPDYPLQRGTVAGHLLVNGHPAEAGTHVILAAPGYDWQAQCSGYIYYTRTTAGGAFSVRSIRPGMYTLYAYGSNQTDEYRRDAISVRAGAVRDLGAIDWRPVTHGEKLWQIGIADRLTKGFKLSDHKRYYGLFREVPANIDFTIGKSHEKEDWYYAQTRTGDWNIHFSMHRPFAGRATLTLALTGVAKNPLLEVYVNKKKIGSLNSLGNDASVYRSAVAGGYYQKKELTFSAALLKAGSNTLTLHLAGVKPGGGILYDAVKLELAQQNPSYTKGALLFRDDFDQALDSAGWAVETTPMRGSSVSVKNGQLLLDTRGGVTVWLKKKLRGNILIEYTRTVLQDTGRNDRVSDLNQFWMATDPHRQSLFIRRGAFREYDSLRMYYAGMGGNYNRTTRFRKYPGDGRRVLLQEYTDPAHLLDANRPYRIGILVKDGSSFFFVNDRLFFAYHDPHPLRQGYFGFRSTKSRQAIDGISIYRVR